MHFSDSPANVMRLRWQSPLPQRLSLQAGVHPRRKDFSKYFRYKSAELTHQAQDHSFGPGMEIKHLHCAPKHYLRDRDPVGQFRSGSLNIKELP
jgi:hypothetical protein